MRTSPNNHDLSVRRDLELESFLLKLKEEGLKLKAEGQIEGRDADIARILKEERKKLLSLSPKTLKNLFPDLWDEFVRHSKAVEKTRREVLSAIGGPNFNVVSLEQAIRGEHSKDGKDFDFHEHQLDGLDQIVEFFKNPGRRSGYVKFPTGMGKTVLFAGIIRAFTESNPTSRVLVLSPRDIVNDQNLKTIERLQPG